MAPRPSPPSGSSYRVQLRPGFGFADAQAIVPYLAELGIMACYSSPHLRANPGSTHGYDICDHSRLNPELGTDAAYEAFTDTLRDHGLGHIVDVVPNHMVADATSNPWWRDVLEHGQSSRFAHYFDIDWRPLKAELQGRVLLPVLGDQYGLVLERGELQLTWDGDTIVLRYADHSFPLNPRYLPLVLTPSALDIETAPLDEHAAGEFASIVTAFSQLPPEQDTDAVAIADRARETLMARERLARVVNSIPSVRARIDTILQVFNGRVGAPETFDRLHDLLERQVYRLASWRTAFDEINYRRFFDVNGLVGLRMELDDVFEATHALLASHVAAGRVTAVRVDHPDGLFDPQAYLTRLERLLGAPEHIWVEKILSSGEELQSDWPVAGTTGYDFLNSVGGLFIDGRNAAALRRAYARLTGSQAGFDEVAYASKLVIMLTSMASELHVLANDLNRLSEGHRRHRDFTLAACRRVLREVIACFPVYRTYISDRGTSPFDRTVIDRAIQEARRRNPLMEASLFSFVRDVLLPDDREDGTPITPALNRAHRRVAMKIQQFTGPVQAKGVEDTAFYRYHVLAAANDVGGHPGHLGVTLAEFHDANRTRLERRPYEMTTTATHDTKRGEDARARVSVLSELPEMWRRSVSDWMRLHSRHRAHVRGAWAPDRNDEYVFYQALLAVWPPDALEGGMPDRASDAIVERLDVYMQKAIREAKVHTSWIDQDAAYGRAVSTFVRKTLTGTTAKRFLASFLPVARRIAGAGLINSLSQLVLKVMSPGSPDFYQGCELWDFTLVDPDNRGFVDFDHRRKLLAALSPFRTRLERGDVIADEVAEMVSGWPDGRIKLHLTTCALRFRRAHAALLMRGAYVPLEVHGPLGDNVIAFARTDLTGTLVTLAPRLVAALVDPHAPGLTADLLEGTEVDVSPLSITRDCTHVFTGERIAIRSGRLRMTAAWKSVPAAALWSPA